ncbi:MAG TPA: M67 family peptidase [Desulfobulbus sp.]|nr:M67 family peptidase [Desulfobulbus sp.]
MKIESRVIKAMIEHARRELPHEACGYLAAEGGTVVRHYELTNTDRAADHFSMDPGEQFAAIGDMRSRNLRPVAVYHSHPATPARPSTEDIRLAFDPDISYVIVSMAGPDPVTRSFRIRKGRVYPEEIEIIQGAEYDSGNND